MYVCMSVCTYGYGLVDAVCAGVTQASTTNSTCQECRFMDPILFRHVFNKVQPPSAERSSATSNTITNDSSSFCLDIAGWSVAPSACYARSYYVQHTDWTLIEPTANVPLLLRRSVWPYRTHTWCLEQPFLPFLSAAAAPKLSPELSCPPGEDAPVAIPPTVASLAWLIRIALLNLFYFDIFRQRIKPKIWQDLGFSSGIFLVRLSIRYASLRCPCTLQLMHH